MIDALNYMVTKVGNLFKPTQSLEAVEMSTTTSCDDQSNSILYLFTLKHFQ